MHLCWHLVPKESVCWSMSGDLTVFILRVQQMSDSNNPGREVREKKKHPVIKSEPNILPKTDNASAQIMNPAELN